jgi:hypothetical protein
MGRLAYLDSLKVLLTALVIAHHAGQAYGPTGGAWPIFEAQRAGILEPFFSVNAGFFMGLFFLISGLFVPGGFDRKGAAGFLQDRLVRFGAPLVIVGLTLGYLTGKGVEVAHLWFVAHLLVYGVLYAGWRALEWPALRTGLPGHGTILGYALALAAVTFDVLNVLPIDRGVTLLVVLPFEAAHVPQYASLFALGLLAARGDWLQRLPTSTGMTWLKVGVLLAVLRYAYPLGGEGLPRLAGGGFNVESLLWSTWEAVMCVGLCVGLLVLFRERYRQPSRLLRWAAPNAYVAYVVHVVPVVVGLQFALAPVSLDPLLKFGIVTVAGVPLSFLLAAGLRRTLRS